VIPISDQGPKRYFPVVNYLLIIANLVVFYFQPGDSESLALFFKRFGLVSSQLTQNAHNPFAYFGIFTSMFLHADFMHLAGNMLYLWIFGDNIEYVLGHVRYLVFYLMVGIGAAALQIGFFPDSNIPMVGASGAISGILGGYLLKFPKNRVSILFFFIIFIRVIKVPALYVLSVWFLFQIYNGYFSSAETGVAWYAHIGGFVSGLILIKIFELYPRYH